MGHKGHSFCFLYFWAGEAVADLLSIKVVWACSLCTLRLLYFRRAGMLVHIRTDTHTDHTSPSPVSACESLCWYERSEVIVYIFCPCDEKITYLHSTTATVLFNLWPLSLARWPPCQMVVILIPSRILPSFCLKICLEAGQWFRIKDRQGLYLLRRAW